MSNEELLVNISRDKAKFLGKCTFSGDEDESTEAFWRAQAGGIVRTAALWHENGLFYLQRPRWEREPPTGPPTKKAKKARQVVDLEAEEEDEEEDEEEEDESEGEE